MEEIEEENFGDCTSVHGVLNCLAILGWPLLSFICCPGSDKTTCIQNLYGQIIASIYNKFGFSRAIMRNSEFK